MTLTSKQVAEVIDLNGGSLIGKTRLQKTVYFLEVAGVGYGFDFQYYHYGPYSEELSMVTDDAIALEVVKQTWSQSVQGHPYATLKSSSENTDAKPSDPNYGTKKAILALLNQYDAVSLELTATAYFLRNSGYKNFWDETKMRKSSKASPDRIEKAKRLLAEFEVIAG